MKEQPEDRRVNERLLETHGEDCGRHGLVTQLFNRSNDKLQMTSMYSLAALARRGRIEADRIAGRSLDFQESVILRTAERVYNLVRPSSADPSRLVSANSPVSACGGD